jgi:hypothetical protein
MTSDVKGWKQLVYVCLLLVAFSLAEEAAPGRPDGCARGSPGVGSPLPGGRRVPASGEGRASLAAAYRCRGVPHTGAAPLPIDVGPRGGLWRHPRRRLEAVGGPARGVARAPSQARHSRAMAPTTGGAVVPGAIRGRSRVPRRPGAGPLRAWSAGGRWARRRGRGRLPGAGSRSAQAPATRARRAWGGPGGVSRPG